MEERTNAAELRVARAVQAHKELVDAHGRDAAVLRALTALFVVFAVVESQAPSWAARLFFLGVFLAAVCALGPCPLSGLADARARSLMW